MENNGQPGYSFGVFKSSPFDRRTFIKGSLAGAGALALSRTGLARQSPGESFRVCLFSDAHVPVPDPESEYRQQERAIKAFELAAAAGPDLMVFGGDNVMAVDQGQSREVSEAQFANWEQLVRDHVEVPYVTCIGNHDIWYAEGNTREDNKAMALESFDMPNRYYAQEAGGWKFLLLDVYNTGGEQVLDEEQWEWLEAELASTTQPCAVVTHGPILSVAHQLVGGAIGAAGRFRELFLKHPHVRLALSGHMHCVEQIEYDEVTYVCAGAVSGSWWGGNYSHFPPAYGLLDLQTDGSFTSEVVFWETPKQAPEGART
jgi:3',5'-cyclic AMP phosphodiesterase CpdA